MPLEIPARRKKWIKVWLIVEGSYQARLAGNNKIWESGKTMREAISKLLVAAKTHGYSGNPERYRVEYVNFPCNPADYL